MSTKVIVNLPATILSSTAVTPTASAKRLDVDKYAGLWYNVYFLPRIFQPENYQNVTAEYAVKTSDDGSEKSLGITNTGYANGTEKRTWTSTAKPLNSTNTEFSVGNEGGIVQVLCDTVGICPARYIVLDFDDVAYKWAMVGDASGIGFWILSRDNVVAPGKALTLEQAARLLEQAIDVHKYDLGSLVKTVFSADVVAAKSSIEFVIKKH